MNQDKMHLINKIFNDKTIRTVWDKDEEKYYVSVVDVAGAISESKDKQSYWRKLKQANKIPEEYLPIRKRVEKKLDYKGLGRF